MRSLFVKLLLWFGLAMVLVNVASFATGILTERRFQPPRSHPFATTMSLFGETAAGIYERDGTSALHSYLDRIERTTSISTVLFDETGRELSGREVPDNARTWASRPTANAPFVVDPPGPPALVARPSSSPFAAQLVTSAQGSKFILVGKLPPGFPGPPRIGEPGSLWFGLRVLARTLLPLLLIGGLFCYLLARYLAKPIVKLRGTTRELSGGNLSARVDPGLLKRRDEIGYLGRDFNLMATHIESLVGAQRRLLTDISHELRSPLARQGVALGLARRRANAEVGPSLDRIGREAERMNQMIGQLLDLSRVENGTDTIQGSGIALSELVEEITRDADYEARDRQRSVRVTALDKCSINGIVELLSSAIENVVRNAVRHTDPETSVEVGLRCSEVNGQRSATITVRDHGRGVPETSLNEIFQPFYRVEEARDRKSGGTGLGLAIAARAVRLHGGTIKASNVTEGGLLVEIILPVTREVHSGKPATRA